MNDYLRISHNSKRGLTQYAHYEVFYRLDLREKV